MVFVVGLGLRMCCVCVVGLLLFAMCNCWLVVVGVSWFGLLLCIVCGWCVGA